MKWSANDQTDVIAENDERLELNSEFVLEQDVSAMYHSILSLAFHAVFWIGARKVAPDQVCERDSFCYCTFWFNS